MQKICYKVVRVLDDGSMVSAIIDMTPRTTYKIGEINHASINGTPIFTFKNLIDARGWANGELFLRSRKHAILKCTYTMKYPIQGMMFFGAQIEVLPASSIHLMWAEAVKQGSHDDWTPFGTLLVTGIVPIEVIETKEPTEWGDW